MEYTRITVRNAVKSDLAAIMELLQLKAEFDGYPELLVATSNQLEQDLFSEHQRTHVLLAEVSGAIAGFATYYSIYSTFLAKPGLWLDDLYVKESYRGQGVGRSLMQRLRQIASETGCGRIDWIVAQSNQRGIQFYQKLGATLQERVRLCRLTLDL
jgi:GNAT superfamily N-acetyltransferase